MSCQKSVLDRARDLRQESICSKHSETGSKAVSVSEALEELEEAQQARVCRLFYAVGFKRNEKVQKFF